MKNKDNINNNANKPFLNENPNEKGLSNSHLRYLGLKTPENYFSKSKKEILDSLTEVKKSKLNIFINNYRMSLSVAASLIILIGITIFFLWFNNTNIRNNNLTAERVGDKSYITFTENETEDVLIASLFVEDSVTDRYIDECLYEEILSDIAQSEQDRESVILNSLFIDDSEMDQYIDEYLLENIIM